jgi:hypothetical protein
MDRPALARLMREGHPIDPRALDDSQYRGVSLGLPGLVVKMTWLKFRKTFHRDPETGTLRGWNVRLEQNGLDAPSLPRTKKGRTWAFGHYEVVRGDERVPRGSQGLLIDYGLGGNRGFGGRIRDPLIALSAGSADALLGWSYLDLGLARVGTPSWFLLEREGPLDEIVALPRRASS